MINAKLTQQYPEIFDLTKKNVAPCITFSHNKNTRGWLVKIDIDTFV